MDKQDLHQPRLELCDYIRSPDEVSAPAGHEDRRLNVYKGLFYRNMKRFLDEGFPLLSGFYSEQAWDNVARAFMRDHRCQTPYFREISREFLLFLQNTYDYSNDDPPFMVELAHYEWAQLALGFAPQEIDTAGLEAEGDLLAGRPQLSPLLCSLRYNYPVHQVDNSAKPPQRNDNGVFLLLSRDKEDRIRCIEGNIVTAHLVAYMAQGDKTGEEILQTVASEIGREDATAVVQQGHEFIQRLCSLDMVIGVKS